MQTYISHFQDSLNLNEGQSYLNFLPYLKTAFTVRFRNLWNVLFYSICSPSGALATLPKEGADICIHGLRAFVESGRVHESEFMYSRGAPCKVRVRLTFNKHKRLSVSVLVAPGEHDDRHTFPLTFSGFGLVTDLI